MSYSSLLIPSEVAQIDESLCAWIVKQNPLWQMFIRGMNELGHVLRRTDHPLSIEQCARSFIVLLMGWLLILCYVLIGSGLR